MCTAFVGIATCHTILEEYHCKDSEVQYGVSLKGGKRAGIFKPLGKTKNIQVTNKHFIIYTQLVTQEKTNYLVTWALRS